MPLPNSAPDTKCKRSVESSFTEHLSSPRRITSSSSLPDISILSSEMATTENKSNNQNPSSTLWTPATKGLSSLSPDPQKNLDSSKSEHKPMGELQTSMINELIVKTINSQAFIGAFAPLIASTITPHIQVIVQSCIQPILSSIQEQQKNIEDQNEQIQSLKQINSDLQQRMEDLECGLDNLEQYGRRTSLRFHNVPIPAAPGSEDEEEVAPDTAEAY
ncbi:uncharacterized protein LOC134232406 [Saccostrea cucullata]|uniref:uncharacterized protein LOC134232406 n=1 Tax=Saccostrea cuccullata TaxID=36930 RepID=UPI002ECFF053